MKKIISILLVVLMLVSCVGCKGKDEPPVEPTNPNENQNEEPNTPSDPIDGDPAEYGRDYWEAKYPGENICPFYIAENDKEFSYYWVSNLNGYDGTIASWLNQPFNWNGWHTDADGCIVNKDETLKITDDWAQGEGMSSFCTVTTEPYDKENHGGSSTNGGSNTNGETNPGVNTDPEKPAVNHNVPEALSFKSQEDLLCQQNFLFAAVYTGTEEDKSAEKDGLFFDFFDESALYCVITGFNAEDGDINGIWGYARLYHFYDDEASYKAALANVPSSLLKEQSDEFMYFTTGNVRNPGATSYSELMSMFENKETDGGEFNNFAPFTKLQNN